MKLSIIVPCYNVEDYVEECLNSLVSLDLNEIEVICVNDGSTDSTLEKIKKFELIFPNFKIINQTNSGLSAARNAGLKIAKGKFCYFLDSDDYIIPELFNNLLSYAHLNNLDITSGNALKFEKGEFKQNKKSYKRIKLGLTSGYDHIKKSIKTGEFTPMVPLNIYKRSFLIENNLYFKEGIIHEDSLHSTLSFTKANRVSHYPVNFYIYRTRQNSISKLGNHKYSNSKSIPSFLVAVEELFKEVHLNPNNKNEIYQMRIAKFFEEILRRLHFQIVHQIPLSYSWTEIRNHKVYLELPFIYKVSLTRLHLKFQIKRCLSRARKNVNILTSEPTTH